MRIISEPEFAARIRKLLADTTPNVGSVTGPGRSGAIAAVYASHILGVPFVPYGSKAPVHLGSLLIIDTAMASGATLRKAERRYAEASPVVLACYEEPPRVAFWYEAAAGRRLRGENDNGPMWEVA
jgi:adenine/guanine phosphoribosyltransferase-like PRPP-binding protein